MKKILTILIASIMALVIAGCGNGSQGESSSAEKSYSDSDFISAMATSLEKRWAITDSKEAESLELYSREYYANVSSAIDAELEVVSEYRNAEFKDHNLQELAIKYINALEDSKETADLLPNDDDSLYDQWDSIYDTRTTIIKAFVDDYGLHVSEEYQSTLDDLTNNAKSVEKETAIKEKVDKIASSLEFDRDEDEYGSGYCTYTTKFTNDTGVNFDYLSFNIDLLDDEGTVIEQQFIHLENVSDGKSYSGEFMTDANFDHYEITADYLID